MNNSKNFKYYELYGSYFRHPARHKHSQFIWLKVHKSLLDYVHYDNYKYRKFEILINVFYDFFIEDYTAISKDEFMSEHTYAENEYKCDSSIILYTGANMDYDKLYSEYLKKWYFYREFYFNRLMIKARSDSKYYKYLADEKKELNIIKTLLDKYGF
jgi:hypothetical protein